MLMYHIESASPILDSLDCREREREGERERESLCVYIICESLHFVFVHSFNLCTHLSYHVEKVFIKHCD